MLVFLVGLNSADAQEIENPPIYYKQSMGGALGNFLNVSYKAFVFDDIAIEANVGSFFFSDTQQQGTYGIVKLITHSTSNWENLYSYYGGGFMTRIGTGFDAHGILFPVGAENIFLSNRFTVHGEIAPVLQFNTGSSSTFSSFSDPRLEFTVVISFGVRFIFHR